MSTKKLEVAVNNALDQVDTSVFQRDYVKLKEDLKAARSHVAELTSHLKEQGMNETRYLKKRAIEQFEDMQDMGTDSLASLEQRVKTNPAQSVLFAFAAGIVASLLLGRRN